MSMRDLSSLILLTSRDFVSKASIVDIHVANATRFDIFFLYLRKLFSEKGLLREFAGLKTVS